MVVADTFPRGGTAGMVRLIEVSEPPGLRKPG